MRTRSKLPENGCAERRYCRGSRDAGGHLLQGRIFKPEAVLFQLFEDWDRRRFVGSSGVFPGLPDLP